MAKKILCADIGGTYSRFALFVLENDTLHQQEQYICATSSLHNTQDILQCTTSMGLHAEKADFFCIGVAGPIDSTEDKAQLTNAALSIDFSSCTWAQKGKNFLLVNDFALQAWASLANDIQLQPILPCFSFASHMPTSASLVGGTRAILGAGTGLGTAALIPLSRGKNWTFLAAEGGHVDMPFYGEEEQDFAHFAQKYLKQSRISAEDVLSARGLSLVHAYVSGETLSPQEAARYLEEEQPQKTTEEQKAKIHSPTESIQLRLYARFLGRFCRNWAVSTLCKGGLYLGGGVLQKNKHILQNIHFQDEFYTAPRAQRSFLKELPVLLMHHAQAGLLGAAHLAKVHLI